ncbi:multidrug ABC transporter permease [Paenibacillus baekrokdamisoli]|uniref:Multidrug ABC transporter permease n=1 Tax=Paenibacillus baekrokdamisoli TaxID=1712516 RepID=A0A3G9JNS4_9BACL|nr:ABC-2 family transporter protein [Paenibacillus baekrokdamisoli]MBB3071275.1 ABC-2 type transport system permease protein [Paenibacillus baekrokdamisoli]BBH24689.1 multidrug ABC transporter permease [Paenibacillus baekrokdamisoli]
MTGTIRYHISVAYCFARLAIQRQLEYPLFLVSWFLMIPLQYLSGVWVLKLMVDQFQPLAGWSFPQLAFLYGLGLLSHGLSVIFFIQTWHIDNMVVNGGFDRMLLRPMNVFFQFIANYINFIGFIDLIPGTLIFLYGCVQSGFEWSLWSAIQILMVVIGGMFIRASICTIMGSAAFWTKRSGSLINLTLATMERTTMYPLTIYPRLVQWLLTFLLPIGFISFYPATELIGQDDGFTIPIGLAIWTPIIGVLMFVLAHLTFLFGLKRYESAGS